LAKLYGYLLKYDVSEWYPIDIVRKRIVGYDMSLNDLSLLEKFIFHCASSESWRFTKTFNNKDDILNAKELD
jgi:hypothetical protein